jgi:outer membrane protein OmpA-like peptidoglycan-associated protein
MRSLLVAAALCAALSACARQELFVVLPNPDGGSGAITVNDGKSSVQLDKPYAASEVKSGTAKPTNVDAGEVQQIFGPALAAQPTLPAHFRLYFISDSDRLTQDSDRLYMTVFDDIKRRSVFQVEVVGHTDTLGQTLYNQQLSLRRAAAIRERFQQDLDKQGLKPTGSISVAGRGQLDLAVPTGDQVSEPKNRRVEITVR